MNILAKKASKLVDVIVKNIKNNRDEVVDLLLNYESYSTTEDELFRSLKCLNNVDSEFKYFSRPVKAISIFFPLNLPLYSLILFGIVPSFLAKKIFIRPPILVRETLVNLYKILKIKDILPHLKILELQRKEFIAEYVSVSDVVVFVGKYENGIELQNNYPNRLFLFNGAGVNPILVTESADINLALKKTVTMRVFNSGQDCAGPDAIIIHSSVVEKFLEKLKKELSEIVMGNYFNEKVLVGKSIEYKHLRFIEKIFLKNRENIVYGGKIDFNKNIIYPTIIVSSINKCADKYVEYFSPIFNILRYNNYKDLDRYFKDPRYLDYKMYVSVFGESKYIKKLKKSIILKNKIVLDVDDGNKPFGGYGKRASFVSYNNKYFSRPILISKEIYNYVKQD